MFAESQNVKYSVETATVMFQGKPITLTSRTPILSPEQREKRKREIESILYNVFKKYAAAPAPANVSSRA
ncbi:MAG: hypothetical protein LBJ10_04790 [Clostridiales bacterium]|jgi:hypothetical protein|nr:hypothetical protein [Clostridiales bacterium]MDR1439333.1 hypothetical protein [Clostridiales bacterium]